MKTTTWMVAVIAGATVALVAPVTHAAAPTTAENAAAQPAFATPQELVLRGAGLSAPSGVVRTRP